MPYIAVHTERSLNAPEKESLKAALGQAITVIPGKKEKSLMVEICDGCDLYYGGQKCDAAYLDVKIFGSAQPDDQKAFIEAAFQVMADAGFDQKNVYITFSGLPNWGVNGTMI
ncbi:MAG: phenylpyruvate tautomerase MIF-related protein [Butyricicoccus sp.]|nr:phenylpyruvate tautomerase MIF-related protein [Butyricicoccus sp.]